MTSKDSLLANLVAQKLENQRAESHLHHLNKPGVTEGVESTDNNAGETITSETQTDETAKAA